MSKIRKTFVNLLSGMIVCIGVSCAYHIFHDYYAKCNGTLFHHSFLNEPLWDIPLSAEEKDHLFSIFSEPFYYLSQGKECIAFYSKDGRYVIKFFKKEHQTKQSVLQKIFPLSSLKRAFTLDNEKVLNKRRKWETNLRSSYTNYCAAFHEIKDKTGLIYIHFNKNRELSCKLKIINDFGKEHLLDLDQQEFVLQYKAVPLKAHFHNLIQKADYSQIDLSLQAIEQFLIERTLSGFTDPRRSLNINFGFLGEKPIQFDVGKLAKTPELKEDPEEEILRLSFQLNCWKEKMLYPLAKAE